MRNTLDRSPPHVRLGRSFLLLLGSHRLDAVITCLSVIREQLLHVRVSYSLAFHPHKSLTTRITTNITAAVTRMGQKALMVSFHHRIITQFPFFDIHARQPIL